MYLQFLYACLNAVFLKSEKFLPDVCLLESGICLGELGAVCMFQEVFKEVIERFVVDEFGGFVLISVRQISQDLLRNIHDLIRLPEIIKPRFQVGAIAFAINFKVQFNIACLLT